MAKKGKGYYFTEKERESILSQALAFWDASTKNMSEFFTRVTDYKRLYDCKLPADLEAEFANYDDRSALVPGDIHRNIRSVRAHIDDLLFESKPYGTVSLPGLPNVRNAIVDKAEQLLSALIDISGFRIEADKINHQALTAGVSGAVTIWHTDYRRTPIRGDDGMPARGKKGQFLFQRMPIISYPRCIGKDIRRIRIDDKAENREDIRIVGYHVIQNLSELLMWLRDPRSPYYFDEKKLKASSFPKNLYYEHVAEQTDHAQTDDQAFYGDKPVEVIEIRGMFRLNDEYEDLIVRIANRDILIDARPNPLPVNGWETIDFATIDTEHNQIFTAGLIEPIEDTFIEMFLKRNQSIDITNSQAYQMYLTDLAASADLPNRIERRDGSLVQVNLAASGAARVTDVFSPISTTVNPVDSFQHSMSLQSEIEDRMCRSAYTKGSDPSRKETATAVNSLEMGGLRDMQQLVQFMAQSYICPVWQKFLTYQDFFKGHEPTTVYRDDGTPLLIEPGEMSKPFLVNIDIAAALDRPIAVRRVVEMMPLWMQLPNVDLYELAKTSMWYTRFPNRDKILKSPEQKIADVERENIALKNGVVQPVHPQDDHEFHLQYHEPRFNKDAQSGSFDLSEKAIMVSSEHMETHQSFLAQANNPTGINTPKSTEGPNAGQLIGGSNPKGTQP